MSDQDLEQRLLELSIKQFKPYNLDGLDTVCTVLRIHDADTCTVGFETNGEMYKTNIRLEGVDCPELHSKIDKEAKLCRVGKAYLSKRCLNKLVRVTFGTPDKYGRTLATIYDRESGESINQQLIEYHFARPYGLSVEGGLHKGVWLESDLDTGIAVASGMGLIGSE